jgi:hypothetical protein
MPDGLEIAPTSSAAPKNAYVYRVTEPTPREAAKARLIRYVS